MKVIHSKSRKHRLSTVRLAIGCKICVKIFLQSIAMANGRNPPKIPITIGLRIILARIEEVGNNVCCVQLRCLRITSKARHWEVLRRTHTNGKTSSSFKQHLCQFKHISEFTFSLWHMVRDLHNSV